MHAKICAQQLSRERGTSFGCRCGIVNICCNQQLFYNLRSTLNKYFQLYSAQTIKHYGLNIDHSTHKHTHNLPVTWMEV